ncbi:MAG: antibiotic biosynthesis monooxygenase [Paracoccus sp. (in: a-proteobacteria)]|uniref:antibiotic biosynthesis monooxygenase family protein n=1 Tax=Paracoccus sp. TaxID=267 RepID=UPI0026E07FC0|nr:antibiotic biosynthesis monooxygenase [Paracoccus sp. (in: a-proteobacteria)]MDO5620030.1 antibiotic biosynthesis monooxygenase [Paracoccus sp. (in: a-proteobacteria)]
MASDRFATLPEAPYFVVTFASQRREGDQGYAEMADRMAELAAQQPGYLGAESARDAEGFGITNSFWADEASIQAWKRDVDHLAAQQLGRQKWYASYRIRIARVTRAYGFDGA